MNVQIGLTISTIALYFNQMKLNLKIFSIALVISLVSTIAELISWKGIDNLLIPLSVLLVLLLML